jgi:hypothetical protein
MYAEFKVIANDTCAMLGIDSNPSESARLDHLERHFLENMLLVMDIV